MSVDGNKKRLTNFPAVFLFCMDAYGLHKNARQSGYEVNDEEPGVSGYMSGMNGRVAPRNNHTM